MQMQGSTDRPIVELLLKISMQWEQENTLNVPIKTQLILYSAHTIQLNWTEMQKNSGDEN